MRALLERLVNPLHRAVAAAALALFVDSLWIELYRSWPADAGWADRLHLVLGLALLPVALLYACACLHDGRWRLYYPWLAGDLQPTLRDLAGLVRGRRPMSEGGGLFGTVEGLLLLALLITALTGAAWYLTEGSSAALHWRAQHILAARACAALLAAHVVAASLHLVDLVRG